MSKTTSRTCSLFVLFAGMFFAVSPPVTRAAAVDLAEICHGFSYESGPKSQAKQLEICLGEKTMSQPERLVALKTRATQLLQLSRPREALADFSEALKIRARDAECYLGIAIAYKQLGKDAEALAHYRMAEQLRKTAGGIDARAQQEKAGDEMEQPARPILIQATVSKNRPLTDPPHHIIKVEKPVIKESVINN